MKIRHKVFIYYGAIKVITCVMVGFLVFGIVANSFNEYSKKKHLENTEATEEIFYHTLKNLRDAMKSWLVWDDSYYFIKNGNKAYIQSNISAADALKNVDLNMMTYWKKNGQYVYGIYSKDAHQTHLLPRKILQLLSQEKKHLIPANADQSVNGFMDTPDGVMYVSSMPIYMSDKKAKPSNGRMIFGRLINKEFSQEVDELTSTSIKLLPVKQFSKAYQNYLSKFTNLVNIDDDNNNKENNAFNKNTGGVSKKISLKAEYEHGELFHYLYTYYTSTNTAYSNTLYWDIDGHPVLVLETSEPTTYATLAIEKVKTFYLFFLIVSLISIFATFRIIDMFLIQPIQYLSKRIADICNGKYRTVEISHSKYKVSDNDEIHQLQNNMSQLIKQLFDNEEEIIGAKVLAESSSQAKSEFLANMSHEIRTPLNSLMGSLELISMSKLSKEQKSYLQIADLSGKNLIEILGDILDFAKIESGQFELNQEAFDFGEMIKEIETVTRHAIEKKGLEFSISIDSNLTSDLVTDKVRLKQIIINLLTNAKKYSNEGCVTLKTRAAEDETGQAYIYIDVTDTGVGIPKEKIASIFERFSQVDNTSTKAYQGIGLGLAICKRLVDFLDGKIGVESELHKGSKFWLEFILPTRPKVVHSEKNDNFIETVYLTPNGIEYCELRQKLKILVVDDQPMNRTIMQKYLNKIGYDCDLAENGQEAIDAFKKNDYDLIFMDIQMPDMDGVEVSRLIRWKAEIQPVIIALTANKASGDIENYLQSGMDDYAGKPVSFVQLKNLIDKWERTMWKRQITDPENTTTPNEAKQYGTDVDMEEVVSRVFKELDKS